MDTKGEGRVGGTGRLGLTHIHYWCYIQNRQLMRSHRITQGTHSVLHGGLHGKEIQNRGGMWWFILLYTRNSHNIVKQPDSSKNWLRNKKKRSWGLNKIKQLKSLTQCLLIGNMQLNWVRFSNSDMNSTLFIFWDNPLWRLHCCCDSCVCSANMPQDLLWDEHCAGCQGTKMMPVSLSWDILAILIWCKLSYMFMVIGFWSRAKSFLANWGRPWMTTYFRIISLI